MTTRGLATQSLSDLKQSIVCSTSEEVDSWLGYQIMLVEATVRPLAGVELWQRQGPAIFQTPYLELAQILEELSLSRGAKMIDLGCGYGRLGIVAACFGEGIHFTGFEISPERLREARRVYALLGLDPGQLIEADLASPEFCPPEADAYFLYDYGTEQAVAKTLEDLKQLSRSKPGFKVVGRGRRSRDVIERGHPWLSQVHAPRHLGNYSIYQA